MKFPLSSLALVELLKQRDALCLSWKESPKHGLCGIRPVVSKAGMKESFIVYGKGAELGGSLGLSLLHMQPTEVTFFIRMRKWSRIIVTTEGRQKYPRESGREVGPLVIGQCNST